MHNLLRFLKLYHFLLLFILIEGFSIFLLVTNNSYQKYTFLTWSQKYTGKIYESSNTLKEYFSLKESNNLLATENAKLYSLLRMQNKKKISLYTNNKYIYQEAKVINNSVFKRDNYITLNKGYKHGLKEGMGVVTANGVIGILHSVSENYSLAISVLHQKTAISVRLNKQRNVGTLKWKGFDYRTANIVDILNHINIEEGDTISTSGYGTIFPEGINVGRIKHYQKNKEKGYYNIRMQFFTDLNTLDYVYIVKGRHHKERIILERNGNE